VIELSATAKVANNLVAGNTLTGILISDSGQVDVWNNTITDNERNINIVQGDRRASNLGTPGHDDRQKLPDPTVTWITGNVTVHNNVIGDGTGNCLLCVEDYSHQRSAAQMNIQSDGNVFQRPSASKPKWAVVWSRGKGNPQVYLSVKDFSTGTGQDRHSYAIDGTNVLQDRKTLTAAVADLQATVALPLPADIAAMTGIPTGTRQLGASD
jgi:parallel beta-helix repeat protein